MDCSTTCVHGTNARFGGTGHLRAKGGAEGGETIRNIRSTNNGDKHGSIGREGVAGSVGHGEHSPRASGSARKTRNDTEGGEQPMKERTRTGCRALPYSAPDHEGTTEQQHARRQLDAKQRMRAGELRMHKRRSLRACHTIQQFRQHRNLKYSEEDERGWKAVPA